MLNVIINSKLYSILLRCNESIPSDKLKPEKKADSDARSDSSIDSDADYDTDLETDLPRRFCGK